MHNPPDILDTGLQTAHDARPSGNAAGKRATDTGSVQPPLNVMAVIIKMNMEDTGDGLSLRKMKPLENYLELRFCIAGNVLQSEKYRMQTNAIERFPHVGERVDTQLM